MNSRLICLFSCAGVFYSSGFIFSKAVTLSPNSPPPPLPPPSISILSAGCNRLQPHLTRRKSTDEKNASYEYVDSMNDPTHPTNPKMIKNTNSFVQIELLYVWDPGSCHKTNCSGLHITKYCCHWLVTNGFYSEHA